MLVCKNINISVCLGCSMARTKKAYPRIHGEKKRQFQFMLTEEASEQLDKIAERLGVSRSEVFERTIRNGGLEAALTFDNEFQTA